MTSRTTQPTSVAVLLCLGTAWSAPRDHSDITYVRIQPITSAHAPRPPSSATLRESRIENLPLTIGSYETVRRVRSDDAVSATYPPDTATNSTVAEHSQSSEEPRTEAIGVTIEPDSGLEQKFNEKQVPGPRFYSKLSYFSKPTEDFDSALSTNLVSTRGGNRRKFRSRCRCEKIWNCPKLQITVPRCPEEYFLCCF